MLLSRFWYFVLALAAAFAVGAALLSQSVVNTRTEQNLEESLMRDRVVLEAMLRLEARARLDRIGFITVDSTLGGLLRQARDADEKKLRELNAQARQTLHGHVKRMVDAAGATDADKRSEIEPDIAFALDINGRILAQLGPMEPNPPGGSLATYPLVRRALQGYLRDDVWVYDRRVYRMAARPVIAGSDYVGAIVHGYRYDKGVAQKLAANLGNATVVFFQGSNVLTSHISADTKGGAVPQAAEIVTAAPKKLGEHKGLVELPSGGRAIYAQIVGDAATQGVGYAIARPRQVLTRPDEVFASVSKDEVNALPWPLLGGGVVLLTGLGLLFMYLERDRHMKSLTRKTAEIASGDRDRLIVTEWRGAYRKLADQINQAIDKWVEKAAEAAPSMRRKADLQEILGHTPETTGTPFFGFASEAEPPSGAVAKPLPAAPPMPVTPMRDKAPVVPTTPNVVPPPVIRSQLAAPAPPHAPAVAGNGAGDEDAHWREVYQQYISTRKQCGESIDNLTFEKLAVTLKKTRDQLIEKHGAAAVRFSVQVKEGKAALKAQPVK
jgi:hypothetical protein